MTAIQLREGHFSSFFEVPFAIHGDREAFVSPLRSELAAMLDPARNPLFASGNAEGTFYTAYRDGEPVGRIVAHVHHAANQRFDERSGSFGFFDCIDDAEVAGALLGQAEAYARTRGCDRIRGNMNLTANQEIGVVVEGHERRPYLAQVFNPAYLARLLEACGYERTHPMSTMVKTDLADWDPEGMITDRHRALYQDPAYTFRPFERARFDQEVEAVREVLNDAMADNYLFVPLSQEEARFQLGSLELVLDPALTRMAEHDGEVIGVALGVPDVVPLLRKMRSRLLPLGWWHFLRGRHKLDGASIVIILVKKAYQARGVIRILTYELMRAARDAGYRTLGGTWIGDDNQPSLKAAEAVGMKPHHRVYMFEKALS